MYSIWTKKCTRKSKSNELTCEIYLREELFSKILVSDIEEFFFQYHIIDTHPQQFPLDDYLYFIEGCRKDLIKLSQQKTISSFGLDLKEIIDTDFSLDSVCSWARTNGYEMNDNFGDKVERILDRFRFLDFEGYELSKNEIESIAQDLIDEDFSRMEQYYLN